MNTGSYIKSDIIVFSAAEMVGDKEFKVISRGTYNALIQEAFETLALSTYFDEKRKDIPLNGGLVYDLPDDCFNVKNIFIFSGDICDITSSSKVYWKRNYFTEGKGYIANDKGGTNNTDPFFDSHLRGTKEYGNQVFARLQGNVNNTFFYNLQQGKLMLSSSCLNAGNKLHIHYHGTGCPIGEAPIIPIYLRIAMQDYVTEAALRIRMANDADPRRWQSLWNVYDQRLNKPYTGSWERAQYHIKTMNTSQRDELAEYLGRGAWASGF